MIRRLVIAGALIAGCGHARTADQYRADTAAAFEPHAPDIKTCYDKVLATTPTATGRVTVTFAVEAKTGHVTDVQLDKTKTTAPDAVSQCVLAWLPATSLTPGDKNRGAGSWSWDFTAKQ